MFKRNDDEYIRPSEEEQYTPIVDEEYEEEEYRSYRAEKRSEADGDSLESDFSKLLYDGDERILWCGKTVKGAGVRAMGGAIISLIFVIFWLSFAIFWTIGAFASGGIMGAFGLLFVAIGVKLLLNVCTLNSQKYAITERRIIILTKMGQNSVPLNQIKQVTAREVKANIGYISFSTGNNRNTMPVSFNGIENPNEVCRILNDAIYDYTKNNSSDY